MCTVQRVSTKEQFWSIFVIIIIKSSYKIRRTFQHILDTAGARNEQQVHCAFPHHLHHLPVPQNFVQQVCQILSSPPSIVPKAPVPSATFSITISGRYQWPAPYSSSSRWSRPCALSQMPTWTPSSLVPPVSQSSSFSFSSQQLPMPLRWNTSKLLIAQPLGNIRNRLKLL